MKHIDAGKIGCNDVCGACVRCVPLCEALTKTAEAMLQSEDIGELFRKAIRLRLELDSRQPSALPHEIYAADCQWAATDRTTMINVLVRAMRRRGIEPNLIFERSPPVRILDDRTIGLYTMSVFFENGGSRGLAFAQMDPGKTNALLSSVMQLPPTEKFDGQFRGTISRWFGMEGRGCPERYWY